MNHLHERQVWCIGPDMDVGGCIRASSRIRSRAHCRTVWRWKRRSRLGAVVAASLIVLSCSAVALAATVTGTAGRRPLGTSGADRISGLAGDDTIVALGGDDRVSGGSGDDIVSGDGRCRQARLLLHPARGLSRRRRPVRRRRPGSDRRQPRRRPIAGQAGDDDLRGGRAGPHQRRRGNDFSFGDASDDLSSTARRGPAARGGGDDRPTPRRRDRVDRRHGDDRIFVRDGTRDRVDCGRGDDSVVADGKDRIDRNCERVNRDSSGGVPAGGGRPGASGWMLVHARARHRLRRLHRIALATRCWPMGTRCAASTR